MGRLVGERGRLEAAVIRPAPEVPGADLPDQIAAVAQMVFRKTALAVLSREVVDG